MAPVVNPEFETFPSLDISITKILLILSIYIHCSRMVYILCQTPPNQLGYEAHLHLLSASCMCLLVLPWTWMFTAILGLSELGFGQTVLILTLVLLACAVHCMPLLACHCMYTTWKDGVMARHVSGKTQRRPKCSRETLVQAAEAMSEDDGKNWTAWKSVGECRARVEKLVRR